MEDCLRNNCPGIFVFDLLHFLVYNQQASLKVTDNVTKKQFTAGMAHHKIFSESQFNWSSDAIVFNRREKLSVPVSEINQLKKTNAGEQSKQ